MGKLAFVFSGQGDQFPGMGRELMEYPAGKEIFDLCDRIRPGTSRQCFAGTEEELRDTGNTQPCLYAVELACCAVLKELGVQAQAAAGFSLGEIGAAAWAGLYSTETGFRLVCRRGELMRTAASCQDAAMAAVLKLPPETVEALCKARTGIYPVNYNCPGQIAVSGLQEQMPGFLADVKAAGGRAVPLKVAGAFHSPFMNQAAEQFREVLEQTELQTPVMPLYSDLTARVYGDNPRELQSLQICNPVRWQELILNMIGDGFDTFVEIGPGRTLTNLIRKINPGVNALTAHEKLEEYHVKG